MKKIIYILAVLMLTQETHAFVEIRGTLGAAKPGDIVKDACDTYCSSSAPEFVPFIGGGADVIISPPLTDWGFGLRYEKIGINASTSTIKADAYIERTSILVNYRLVNTLVHMGPLFTYGIGHSTSFKISENNNPVVDYKVDKITSASIGFEIGVKPLIVIPLAVGAEAGYQYTQIKDATEQVHSTTKSLDLSGPYLKAYLGLDF